MPYPFYNCWGKFIPRDSRLWETWYTVAGMMMHVTYLFIVGWFFWLWIMYPQGMLTIFCFFMLSPICMEIWLLVIGIQQFIYHMSYDWRPLFSLVIHAIAIYISMIKASHVSFSRRRPLQYLSLLHPLTSNFPQSKVGQVTLLIDMRKLHTSQFPIATGDHEIRVRTCIMTKEKTWHCEICAYKSTG